MLLDEIKAIKSTKKELRDFGLVVGGVLAAIGLLLLWRHRPAYPYFLGIGGSLVLLGLVVPRVLLPLQKVWMAFAVVMGFVMTRVILFILYFFVMTPIAVIGRLAGSRFLDMQIDKGRESYWEKREQSAVDKARQEKQF